MRPRIRLMRERRTTLAEQEFHLLLGDDVAVAEVVAGEVEAGEATSQTATR